MSFLQREFLSHSHNHPGLTLRPDLVSESSQLRMESLEASIYFSRTNQPSLTQHLAFSEMVPVLHLVGVPSTKQQKTKPMLHHTLGDGRFDAYVKAAEQFTFSQILLTDKKNAASEIDRALVDSITAARPVYLALPTDLVFEEISSERLSIPLSRHPASNDEQVEAFVLDLITKHIEEAAGDVVVLVDACAIRHDVRKELDELLKKTSFPVYATPMGKTAVDENYERYGGVSSFIDCCIRLDLRLSRYT